MQTNISVNTRPLSRVKILPQSFEEAEHMAKSLSKSTFVPPALAALDPTKLIPTLTGIIILGADLGLSPVQILQYIQFFNGKVSLSTDCLRALVSAHPLCEYIRQEEVRNPETNAFEGMKATVKRKGDDEPHSVVFTMADATRADLLNKSHSPWKGYPKRMMAHRATAFAIRDKFSDLLAGLSLTSEEIFDIPEPEIVQSATTEEMPCSSPKMVVALREITDEPPTAQLKHILESKILESIGEAE